MGLGIWYGHESGSGLALNQGPLAGAIEMGNRFHTTVAVDVNGLAFYWPGSGNNSVPSRLTLWEEAVSTPVIDLTSIPTPTVAGWQFLYLPSVVTLPAGTYYRLAGTLANNQYWTSISSPLTNTTPAGGLVLEANYRCYHNGGFAYPDSSDAYTLTAYDLSIGSDVVYSPTDPATVGSVDSSLADWLSSDSGVNLHQSDGLPWLSKVAIDAIKVVTDKLGHSGSGNSLDWIVGLWRLAGDLTDAEIGLLKLLLDRKDQLVGASGGGGSAFYGPSGTQVSAGVETLLGRSFTLDDLGAAVALLREQLTLSPDLADTSRWTLVDTFTGSGDALINAQADAYFFTLTTIPGPSEPMGIAGQVWEPRWGWVAPRVHGHFTQRQFQDVLPAVFTANGHFMDGLLIYAHPGYEWQVEPYVLDRP